MTITTTRGKRGLGDDGAEKIKRHAWFKGTDWDSESRTGRSDRRPKLRMMDRGEEMTKLICRPT
jgi:hypothetical protein